MILLLHIFIALTNIIQTVILLVSPTQKKMTLTYILLAGTIGSGSYLIITKPAHMVQTCIEGLLFIGFVVGGIVIAQKRLVKKLA